MAHEYRVQLSKSFDDPNGKQDAFRITIDGKVLIEVDVTRGDDPKRAITGAIVKRISTQLEEISLLNIAQAFINMEPK